MGIRKLVVMNAAILCKWWWRYGLETNALWYSALGSKYNIAHERWMPYLPSNAKVLKTLEDILSIVNDNPIFRSIVYQEHKNWFW